MGSRQSPKHCLAGLALAGAALVATAQIGLGAPVAVADADLVHWASLLGRPARERLGAPSALARRVALVLEVNRRWSDLLSEEERDALLAELHQRAVERSFRAALLEREVRVDEAEALAAFAARRADLGTPRGVRALELFLWAPRDLPALRAEQRQQLEAVRQRVASVEDFAREAEALSDATSAVHGGRLGTLAEDRLPEPLRAELLSGHTGISEILGSSQGLFLFWVTGLTPARTPSFAEVEASILRRLRQERLAALLARRGPAWPAEQELAEIGVPVDPVDPVAREVALFERIWPRLLGREWDRRDSAPLLDAARASLPRPPSVERWSFDLLEADAAGSPETFFAVLRVRHELGAQASLPAIREELTRRGLHAEIRRFREVTAREAAVLGPEIHTTLRTRLAPGELSKPLALADRHQVVVVVLHSRRVDPEASREALEAQVERRARRLLERRMEEEILAPGSARRAE